MPDEELMYALQGILDHCSPEVTQNGPVDIFEQYHLALCEVVFRGKVYYLTLTHKPL